MNAESEKRLILFVCTGNTCRSPMAAALFNKLNTSPGWHAESAGLAAFSGDPASSLASTAMRLDFDLDLSAHRSRPVTEDLLQQATWILTMTGSQRDILRLEFPGLAARIQTIGEMAGMPDEMIPDPFGQGLKVYQDTAAALAEMIKKIISSLR